MLFCPECRQQSLTLYMGGNFGSYLCKACGYCGPLVIEEVPKKIKIPTAPRGGVLRETSVGIFNVGNTLDNKEEVTKPLQATGYFQQIMQKKVLSHNPVQIREPLYYRQEFKGILVYLYDLSFSLISFGHAKKIRAQFLHYVSREMKTILDMATGTGAVAITVKKAFPKAAVMGIDLSNTMLQIAEKKAQAQQIPVSFLLQNIEKTQFRNGAFDAITLSFGLHELPLERRRNVLKEAYRLLKKGGTFIIMDYHRPKNALFRMLLNVHIWLVEKYAKSILDQDLVQEMQKSGFKKAKKECIYADVVQVVVGEK